MIGPHQGKELQLMLDGQKHLAAFHDIVKDGYKPSEQVIPEQAFAPYIAKGKIKRFTKIFAPAKLPTPIQYVCFTLPDDEWRAEAFFWMHEECNSGRRPYDDAYEYFIGRLLDYSEEDILHFIEHQKSFRGTLRTNIAF